MQAQPNLSHDFMVEVVLQRSMICLRLRSYFGHPNCLKSLLATSQHIFLENDFFLSTRACIRLKSSAIGEIKSFSSITEYA